ncbi:nickel ABC transporter substrate-binding protein [Aliarcobacter vitoriensis]|uniref:nickel ABC transporter substrate-binding protein n=2 Tax=Aliarcobacter TaxID=2321111 RepID=UPI003AAFD7E2
MKKLFILSFILLITFFISACNENNTNKKKELVYASTKDIRIINPHLYSGEMSAQNMVFEPLVINTAGDIKPWLASSWEILDEGKTYIFHLRDDVKFTDGTKFNAYIVKQNIDAILENRSRHAWLELVNQISKSEVVDEFTYKLSLKNPYYPTLIELALTRPFRFIAPQYFINGGTKDGVTKYIGTGPFILSEHKKNEFAIFKKNENYWGEKAKLDSVKWKVLPDHQTILLALQKGEIDLIFGADGDMINIDAFNVLQKQNKFNTILSNPTASRAILLNTKQEILNDNKIRLALQYAINKEDIISGILNNSETIAHTLFSPTVEYCDIPLELKTFDLEKSKKLLDESGWILDEKIALRKKDDKTLTLKLYFNINNAQEKIISEYIQSNLKNIGIDLKIIGEEKQAFLDRQKSGDFDLQYSLSWGVPSDPQSYISSFRLPAHGDYQAQLGLDKKSWLDENIQKVLIESNIKKRKSMYADIFRYIHNENVYIPLSYSRTKAVFSKNLKGVEFNISQYEIPFEKMFFE